MNSSSEYPGPTEPKLRTRVETVFERTTERVANTYAEALLQAAQKEQQFDEVLDEFEDLVQNVFRMLPDLEKFLSSSAVAATNIPGVQAPH